MYKTTIKTCFISAPIGIDTQTIQAALRVKGIKPVPPVAKPKSGVPFATQIRKAIEKADLFIAVLDSSVERANLYFELGFAVALEKPLLVIAPPSQKDIPESLQDLAVIYSEPDNTEAIEFALEQIKQASVKTRKSRPSTSKREWPDEISHTVRPERDTIKGSSPTIFQPNKHVIEAVDESLDLLREARNTLTEHELENLVFNILNVYGFSAVRQGKETSTSADIAIWADELESVVGNPFLIEIKKEVRNTAHLHSIREQVTKYFTSKEHHWVLLLYLNENFSKEAYEKSAFKGLLVLRIDDFLQKLKEQSFTGLISNLRNRWIEGEGF